MIPVIALVGRPNVGKSTLFNRLTRTRNALVASVPGLTRDRQYGKGVYDDHEMILIDTGGLSGDDEGVDALMAGQTRSAIDEADVVFFLVDARAGRTGIDEQIAELLRSHAKRVVLVANKIDGANPDFVTAEFASLGLGDAAMIAAVSGEGLHGLVTQVSGVWDAVGHREMSSPEDAGTRIAIVGRPNVGKSTLVNRMLGEDRVVTFAEAGTTRDSIYIPYERADKRYTLIDTAGVRRRGRVTDTVEKFSIVKTLDAIQDCDVAVLLMDGAEGIVEQDLHLLSYVVDAGRALVIAVNKWDGLSADQRDLVRREIDRRLVFLNYAEHHFISALHGSGVGELYESIDKAYASATAELRTSSLNRILQRAVEEHPPPLVRGRRIKLRYANVGGHNPPVIVIHGNQTRSLPDSYRRYLERRFIEALDLVGTPVRLELRAGANPYAGRKNPLTPRQERRRARMMTHVRRRARKQRRK